MPTGVVALLFILPFSVHASMLSSLAGLFTIPASVVTYNASAVPVAAAGTTSLLNASQNPDPLHAIGGGDVTVNDGAIVSTGPVGANVIAANKTAANNGQISVYVVRPGDTLSQIAEMYGVTSNTILWANDLKSARDIHPGDSLVILPIAGIQHEVQKGESLASIAKKYGADASDIAAYNQLSTTNELTVGSTIIIPNGEMPAPVAAATGVTHAVLAGSGQSPHPTEPLRLTPAERATDVSSRVAVGHVAVDQAGWLLNPVPGAIKTQGLHGYNGVDLGASVGTHVRAAASGEVIVSKPTGWSGGYGHYIVIKHSNGIQTLYAHLSANVVSAGQHVTAGQYIGNIGMTGKTTGPHLHFEVRGGVNPF